MKAVLLVSHGSRSSKTKEEIMALVQILRRRLPGTLVDYAFLEIESPSIPEGLEQCISQGATEIVVALNFLNAGRHVNEDVPSIISAAKAKYPTIKFFLSTPVGQHPKIPDLFLDLIHHAVFF